MADSTQKTIMVAEDDKFLVKVYEAKLAKEGFNVSIACDGEEAMQKLAEGVKPDIVLLDLIMPKKSGFEVLAQMKKDPNLSTIPVIILSNLGQEEDLKKGMAAGASDYIIKSNISIEEVVTKIKKHLNNPAPTPPPATPPVTIEPTSPQEAPTPPPAAPAAPSIAPASPPATPDVPPTQAPTPNPEEKA